jgi:hypothetical protein
MCNHCSKCIEHEAFYRMVVKRSKGIRAVKTVVVRMNVAIEELVGVEVAMPEVLPCVEKEAEVKKECIVISLLRGPLYW